MFPPTGHSGVISDKKSSRRVRTRKGVLLVEIQRIEFMKCR